MFPSSEGQGGCFRASSVPSVLSCSPPALPIKDAVRVELEAIAFRDGLKKK
jgi:hypothetical protein